MCLNASKEAFLAFYSDEYFMMSGKSKESAHFPVRVAYVWNSYHNKDFSYLLFYYSALDSESVVYN